MCVQASDQADGDELSQIVYVALSRVLGRSKTPDSDWLNLLCHATARWARTPVGIAGEELAPPVPDVVTGPFSKAETVLRRLDIDWVEIKRRWEDEVTRYGICACLPREIIDAFVPRDLHRALEALVLEGPAVACQREERSSYVASNTPPQRLSYRHREDARLALGTLVSRSAALRRFMNELVRMQNKGYTSDLLESWTGLPDKEPIPGRDDGPGMEAPPRRIVRLAWTRVAADIERRWGPIEDAKNVIARQPLSCKGGFRDLRMAVLLICLAVIGSRIKATMRLTRGDFIRMADGNAAFVFRPGKSMAPEAIRIKRLPEGAALYIEAYLAYVERFARTEITENSPLLLGTLRAGGAWSKSGIRKTLWFRIGGLALKILQMTEKRRRRISHPHALRAAAAQLCQDGAQGMRERGEIPMNQEVLSEILLDHRIPSDPHGYKGWSSRTGREKYTAIAIAVNWRMLTTDAGARKVLDSERMRKAVRLRKALEAEIANLRSEGRELDAAVSRARSNGRRLDEAGLLDAVAKLTRRQSLMDQVQHLRDELSRLEAEIDELAREPERRVAVPDDIPLPDEVGLAEIETEEEGSIRVHGRRKRILRGILTISEFSGWAGVSRATGRRRVLGELSFPDGDPRNPWTRDSVPLVELSERKRAVVVAGINPLFRTVGTREQRLNELLTTLPAGWDHAEVEEAEKRFRMRSEESA